jgi:lysophospholipase L1-like esterase
MGNTIRRLKPIVALLQTAWSIAGITLVVLCLTEAGFRAFFAIRDHVGATNDPDRRVLIEGYAGATWPVDHYRELERLEEHWGPYVCYRQRPFQGKTINIGSDGRRATWRHPTGDGERTGPRAIKLLMLGGSSLWGFGARDDQTIPSLVARNLDGKGYRVEIKNLAEIGYTSTQELVALMRELQSGYRPDVVAFYDGVNDTTSAFLAGEAGLTTNEINRRQEFNLLQSTGRLAKALSGKLLKDCGSYRFAQAVGRKLGLGAELSHQLPANESMRSLSEQVALTYEANLTLAESLGKSYGFRSIFFWQPIVFTKPARVASERDEATKWGWTERMFAEVYSQIHSSLVLKSDRAFRDLSGIFADTEGLVFIDYCHTTEAANAPIADAIVQSVIAAVKAGLADDRKASPLGGGPGGALVK